MGLEVVLVDCNGKLLDSISDPKNFLHRLLPEVSEHSNTVLSKVDWYGDTVFNYLQIKQFLEEWDDLSRHAQTSEERALVEHVRGLAVRCSNDRLYLKFIGD